VKAVLMPLGMLRELPMPGVYAKGSLSLLEAMQGLELIYREGGVGAVSTFLGVARASSRDGRAVRYIEMEAYERNANLEIARICREVTERHGLIYTGVWHLLGRFSPGEPVVLVATAGARRRGVLDGLEEAVERYKREPALFKKEVYEDGSYSWVEG